MAFDAKTERLISLKKLSGKAHTSNDKGLTNEGLPSGLSLSANTVFGQTIPVHTGSSTNYEIISNPAGQGVAEYLRLSASFINGTDTSDGRHGFSLQLPDDYESASSNPRKGDYPFLNSQKIYITSGSLQLIPPSFDPDYEAAAYHTSSAETQIPVLDSRDWSLDYFNGIFFQQDPPGTGDQATNPRYIDAYLYVGEYVDKGFFETGMSGSLTQLIDGRSYLSAGDNVTITSSSNGQVVIAASGGGGGSFSRVRTVKKVTAAVESNTTFTITGADMSTGEYDPSYIDIFLNGQLLLSGSATEVTDGDVDYTVTGASTAKFSFGFNADDIVTAIVFPRVSFSRAKTIKKVTASVESNTTFTITGADMSVGEYDPNYIDIFLNGQLLLSGTDAEVTAGDVDYTVTGASTAKFSFGFNADDIVTAIVFPK